MRETGAQPANEQKALDAAVVESRLGEWTRKLASIFDARKQAPKRAVPEFKAPVQTELSLDRVKVVRNDLSETDLEVVMAKAPAAQQTVAARSIKRTETADVKPAPGATIVGEVPGETCSAVGSTVR